MEKVGNRVKSFCLAIIAMFVFGLMVLLSGCAQSSFFLNLQKLGYSVNRIVYTNNLPKYLSGKTLLDGVHKISNGGSSSEIDFAKCRSQGMYAYISDAENNIVDVVFDSTAENALQEGGATYPMISYLQEYAMLTASFAASFTFCGNSNGTISGMVPFSNKYLFANEYELLELNYKLYKKGDESCTCGYVNQGDFSNDYHCGCKEEALMGDSKCLDGVYKADGTPVDETLGLRNLYNSIEAIPRCCYTVTEIFKTDETTGQLVSTNTFQVESICNGELDIKYDTPHATKVYEGELKNSEMFVDYNELIIDGFDLNNYVWFMESILSGMMNRPDFNQMGIAERLDFSNFSYMFYDVPCKKITLNNIKWADDVEVEDLSHMFANCKNLVTVNFGNFFYGVQPKDVSNMFFNCPNLAYVNLTTLDTSKVENMSNMFSFNSNRQDLIAGIINSQLIPLANKELGEGTVPQTNNGQPWTWETAAVYFAGMDEDTKEMYEQNPERTTKIMKTQLLSIILELGFVDELGISYEEFAMMASNSECVTLEEFVDYVNKDPSKLGLQLKTDGSIYTQDEITKQMDAVFEELKQDYGDGLYLGKEEDFVAPEFSSTEIQNPIEVEVNREEYVAKLINTYMNSQQSVEESEGLESVVWTWDSAAMALIESDDELSAEYQTSPEIAMKKARVNVLFLLLQNGLLSEFTFSFDEFVFIMSEAQISSLEDFVVAFNADPTAFGMTAKEDGTDYTREEVKEILVAIAGQASVEFGAKISLVDEEVVETMKITEYETITISKREIVLGGEDSKFVISEGVNTANMFSTNVDIIVVPIIAEGVEVFLSGLYEDSAGVQYNKLTSANANQTLNLYVEPPATDDKVVSVPTFVAVLLGVLVLAAGVVAILFTRAPKKKNAFEIIMSVLKNNL